MREVQLHEAKASLQGKPVLITRDGERQAVIVSYKEWVRLSTVPSFGRLLMAAPFVVEDLSVRVPSPLRE